MTGARVAVVGDNEGDTVGAVGRFVGCLVGFGVGVFVGENVMSTLNMLIYSS